MKISLGKNTKKTSFKTDKGYILLLSVLISGIVLAIGIGIANITLKGIILASVSKNSQFAFYAADSGGECALYWDIDNGPFNDTVFATSSASNPPTSGVICVGKDIAESWIIDASPTSATTQFSLNLGNDRCTTIIVIKSDGGTNTIIESRGYNSCDVTFSRRVERGIRIRY